MPAAPERRSWRAVVECVTVMLCSLTFAVSALSVAGMLVASHATGGRDVVSYWAAGQQVVHGQNPYDAVATLTMERAAAQRTDSQALLVRNPPWALCLVLPLGLMGLPAAVLLWTAMLLACFAGSVHLLWAMTGRPPGKAHLLAYSFGPALLCVLCGQTALFALAGLVLFLRYHGERPFLAGLALWLCALKPHLFLPVGVVLLLWVVATRSYRVLAGVLTAVAATAAMVTWLDPSVWGQYRAMLGSSGMESEFIPCLAVALRFAVNRHWLWLQSVPAALGCVWAATYYWRRRAAWDWLGDGALLLLVSIVVSPYGWITDQALVLPALWVGVRRCGSRSYLWALAVASAAVQIEQYAGGGLHSPVVLWTAPFWLVWFLAVSGKSRLGQRVDGGVAAPQELIGGLG